MDEKKPEPTQDEDAKEANPSNEANTTANDGDANGGGTVRESSWFSRN